MSVAQNGFGFSDEGAEDAIYDSQSIRRFIGIDLARESAPDVTTRLKFRRLLEEKGLTDSLFNAINAPLAGKGLSCARGRWWMRRSSRPLPRPRAAPASVILTDTNRTRSISCTSA